MTPIRYIGPRPEYTEGTYGSRLVFVSDEIKKVPDDLAAKLLKHPDVYELAGDAVPDEVTVAQKPDVDDTEDLLQSARDAVANMNKATLEEFAQTNFRIELNKQSKLADLRLEVIGLIDQYGLPL